MSRYLIEEKVFMISKKDYKKLCSRGLDDFTISRLQPVYENSRIENWKLVQPSQDLEKKRKNEIDLLFSNLVKDNKIRAYYSRMEEKLVPIERNIFCRIYVQITPLEDKRKCGFIGSPKDFIDDYEREWNADRKPRR